MTDGTATGGTAAPVADALPAASGLVRSRLVLNFPGFEGTPPESQLDRIRHSAGKTAELWGFRTERRGVTREPGANHAIAEVDSEGRLADGTPWRVDTRIVQFSWNDVIAAYESEAHPKAFLRNLPKFLAFFTDGTVGRYWRASRRYFGFTLFPLLLLGIYALVGWFALGWLLSTVLSGWALTLATLAATIALVLVLAKWPGEKQYILLTVNDWGFARDMVNRASPMIEARYDEFAATLAREVRASRADEIVVSGHSFGSVWAVTALARALRADPDLLAGRRVTFLALGSSLLKVALAPAAQFIRDDLALVLAQPDLFWHEVQTKDDWIAFYKADPFEALGLKDTRATVRIDRVKYKQAMEKRRYREMRRSFYRTHRQYILYQDVRVPYDYQLRLFGPLPARELALDPALTDRLAASLPSETAA